MGDLEIVYAQENTEKIIHNGAFVLQSFNIINIKLLVITHD